ncbi:spermatogenesis-associated protein 4 isoform X2 [Arapaima gigas]
MAVVESPQRAGLPREVLKWLLSLDLSLSPKNPRRDFSNGYLAAEVFFSYYPDEFPMHNYVNGTSLLTKLSNWSQIERSLLKQNMRLPKEVIEGTIHCKPGAAELLIQEMYVLLTNRRIKSLYGRDIDFTDRSYQGKLPMVARTTTSGAIKSNLRLSEVLADPRIDKNKQKVQDIIQMHQLQRQMERTENLRRFTQQRLGRREGRFSPASDQQKGSSSQCTDWMFGVSASALRSTAGVQFREIHVKQAARPPGPRDPEGLTGDGDTAPDHTEALADKCDCNVVQPK